MNNRYITDWMIRGQFDNSEMRKSLQQVEQSMRAVVNLQSNLNRSNANTRTEYEAAAKAASQLETAMRSAYNVNTKNLDLGTFAKNIQRSEQPLQEMIKNLRAIGPEGETAFQNLARSLSYAENPTVRLNSKVIELTNAFKTMARFQLSNAFLQGGINKVSEAYNYAQELNTSLNNIRIVTGKSTEEMARFAEQANQAAKALSSTTTTYTDAALIYYQQGLDADKVKERTEATLKMANVSRENATAVSEYMTAIWNNFEDGSHTVEHYGDVMANLGANTAASTKEIAAGISKFASVTKTIGLSYDYATSALATVVDKTKESADTVGTAYKTLFSRIEGLSLGKTLDDGTTLTKYSAALAKVGVNIKDANGELKDMDTILDEMGETWTTLSKDQQFALAQTVAGARQYTYLVSLMENYDSFKKNVDIARDSDGTLDKQAEIYSESWEAARNRVRAAWEGMYTDLVNDEAFITMLNSLEKAIELVDDLIDGFGGLGGVLSVVMGAAMPKMMGGLSASIQDTYSSLRNITNPKKSTVGGIMGDVQDALEAEADPRVLESRQDLVLEQQKNKVLMEMKQQQLLHQRELTQEEQQAYEGRMRMVEVMFDEAVAAERAAQAAEEVYNTKQIDAAVSATENLISKQREIQNFKNSAPQYTQYTPQLRDNINQQLSNFRASHNLRTRGISKLNDIDSQESKANEMLATLQTEEANSGFSGQFKQDIAAAQQLLKAIQDIKQALAEAQNIQNTQNGLQANADKYEEMYKKAAISSTGLPAGVLAPADFMKTLQQAAEDTPAGEAAAKRIQDSMSNIFKALEQSDRILRRGANEFANIPDLIDDTNAILDKKQDKYDSISKTGTSRQKHNAKADIQAYIKGQAAEYQVYANDIDAMAEQLGLGSDKRMNTQGFTDAMNKVKADCESADIKVEDLIKDFQALQVEMQKTYNDQNGIGAVTLPPSLEQDLQEVGVSGQAAKGMINAGNETIANGANRDVMQGHLEGTDTDPLNGGRGGFKAAETLGNMASIGMQLYFLLPAIKENMDAIGDSSTSASEKWSNFGMIAMQVATMAPAFANLSKELSPLLGKIPLLKDAFSGLGGALTSFLGLLGPVGIAVGAVTIAVVAGAKAWYDWQEAAPQRALAEVKEEAEALKAELDKTKETLSDMESKFDNYNKLYEAFQTAKASTSDWNEELLKTNEALAETLRMYPEIASIDGALEQDENGVWHLTEKGQQDALELVRNKEAVQQSLVTGMENQVRDSELAIKENKIYKTFDRTYDDVSGHTGTGYDGAGEYWTKEDKEAIIRASSVPDMAEIIADRSHYGITADQAMPFAKQLFKELGDVAGDLKALDTDRLNNDKLADITNQNEAVKILQDAGLTDLPKLVLQQAGEIYEQLQASNGGQSQEAQKAALEAAGYTNVTAKDDGSFVTQDGDEEKSFTAGQADAAAALLAAREQLPQFITEIATWQNQLLTSGDRVSEQFVNLTQNLAGLSKNDFNALNSQIGDANGDKKAIAANIQNYFGTENIEAYATLVGKSVEDVLEGLANQFLLAKKNWDSVTGGLTSDNDFNLATANGYQASIQRATDNAGLDASKITANIKAVETMYAAVDTGAGNLDKFNDVLKGMDWTTIDATDFSHALNSAGISLNATTEDIWNFIHAQREVEPTAADIEANYELASMGLGKISSKGIIKDDELKNFDSTVIDMFFKSLGNGTSMLIGTIDQLRTYLAEAQNNSYLNLAKTAQEDNHAQLDHNLDRTYNISQIDESTKDTVFQTQSQGYFDGETKTEQYSRLELQLDLLSRCKDESAEFYSSIKKWKGELSQGTLDNSAIQAIADEMQKHSGEINSQLDTIIANNTEAQNAINNTALNASSTTEYNTAEANAEMIGMSVDDDVHAQVLMNLAANYSQCADEIEKYRQANEETQKAARYQLELSVEAAEHAAANDLNARAMEMTTKAFAEQFEAYENLAGDAEAAADAAERYIRLNDGVADIAKNYQDYAKILEDVRNATDEVEQATALAGESGLKLQEALADILNTSADLIDADLVSAIDPDTFLAVAQGDEEAINSIREAFVRAQAEAYNCAKGADEFLATMADLEDGATIDIQTDDFLYKLAAAALAAGQSAGEIKQMFAGMDIDCDVTPIEASMLEAENAALQAGDAIVQSLGFNAKTETKKSESTDIKEDTPFDEEYRPEQWVRDDEVLQAGGGDGVTPTTIPVRQIVTEWHKSVTAEPQVVEDKKEETAMAVKIENAHKSAGGKVSSTNKGTARVPRSSSGGGRRAAARRSPRRAAARRGSERRRSNMDKLDPTDEKERYHVVSKELKSIQDELDTIGKAKDRAFGDAKIDKIAEEGKALQQELKIQQKYKKEIQDYLKRDSGVMKGYGARIDEKGIIQNYDALVKKEVDAYNKAIAKYNKSGQSDKDKELVEKAKEKYDTFKKELAQYEETVQLLRDKTDEIIDLENQIYDNKLESIEYKVQVNVDINDRELKLLEERLEQLGEKADKATQRIANFGSQVKETLDSIQINRFGIGEILSHVGLDSKLVQNITNGAKEYSVEEIKKQLGGKTLTDQEISDLRDYSESLLEANASLRQLEDEVFNTVTESFAEYADAIEDVTKKIEHLQKVTAAYKDVISIVGKKVLDPSGALTKQLDNAVFEQSHDRVIAAKSELNFIEESIVKTEKARAQAQQEGNKEEVRRYDDILKDMESKRQSAYESWLDAWEQECQAAADMFEDTLNQIVENFENSLAGSMGSLSALSDRFNRISTTEQIFVSDYEKIYQLSKLTRDINNSIDDTDNIRSKKALRELAQQVHDINESDQEMSQYDLDYLRKKYEMELALEKLHEAQNAKSAVTMRKDSEGNWGYVYTADDSAVKNAEQDYETKLYEMQKLNADYIESLQSEIISAEQECSNAISQLRASDFASYEEYQAAIEQVMSDYQTRVDSLYAQMDGALSNQKGIYMDDWAAYSAATAYKISEDNKFIDSFDETKLSLLTGFDNLETAQNMFSSATAEAFDNAVSAYDTWREQTQTSLGDVGTSINDYASTTYDAIANPDNDKSVVSASAQAAEASQDMATKFNASFSSIVDGVKGFVSQYAAELKKMVNENSIAYDSITKLMSALTNKNSITDSSKKTTTTTSSKSTDTRRTSTTSSGRRASTVRSRTSSSRRRKSYTVRQGDTLWDITRTYLRKEPVEAEKDKLYSANKSIIEKTAKRYGYSTSVYKGDKGHWIFPGTTLTIPFRSGGYTGNWVGNEGKIATLHKKEIVLNEKDTKNFLSAVNIVREVAKMIDLNAMNSAKVSAGFNSSISGVNGGATDKLEQEVHITANFPGVSNRNEIEEAFGNLVNTAAQYIGRKS